MIIYVDANAGRGGNGSKEIPFRSISDAAEITVTGDEVLVMPGVYTNMDSLHISKNLVN